MNRNINNKGLNRNGNFNGLNRDGNFNGINRNGNFNVLIRIVNFKHLIKNVDTLFIFFNDFYKSLLSIIADLRKYIDILVYTILQLLLKN